jgi:hypothetical protein
VIHRPRSRIIGIILALSGAFAAPVSALAHGNAHRHEADVHAGAEHTHLDHSVGADADAQHRTDASGVAGDNPSVKSPDRDAGEHPHPSVDAAVTTKTTLWAVAVVAAHVMLPIARVAVVSPPQPQPRLQVRVEAAHAPPPRLRAPPAFFG